MQIHLNEVELHSAVHKYIEDRGIDLSGLSVHVKLTAGRGERGFYADVDIDEPAGEFVKPPFETEEDSPNGNLFGEEDAATTLEPADDQPALDFD